MKKIIILLITIVLLAACGGTETTVSPTEEAAVEETAVSETPTEEATTDIAPDEDTEVATETDSPAGEAAQPGQTGNRLTDGPPIPGEYGPLSASDLNRDGTVTRTEIEAFMDEGPYRRLGLVAFFDLSDTDQDQVLSEEEFAAVDPPYAFDGTDADADGVVTRAEVEAYVANRLYRQVGLGAFFEMVDTDQNDELSPDEIEASLESGLLTLD